MNKGRKDVSDWPYLFPVGGGGNVKTENSSSPFIRVPEAQRRQRADPRTLHGWCGRADNMTTQSSLPVTSQFTSETQRSKGLVQGAPGSKWRDGDSKLVR